MAKKNSAKAAKRKAWRKCAGVNSRTGRIKPGYKAAKGGCPTKVTKAGGKKGKKQITYYTGGGGTAMSFEEWKAKRAAAGFPEMPQVHGASWRRRKRRR